MERFICATRTALDGKLPTALASTLNVPNGRGHC
jgi:hypothetical protein